MNTPNFQEDYKLILDVLPEAGKIALKHYHTRNMEVTYKEGDENNPLTQADLEVDTYLKEALLEARPTYGWLSEETADDEKRLEKDFVWIVDPIDGTKSFVKRTDEFAISIALAHKGEIVVGVVCNPVKYEVFGAYKGSGLKLNGEVIERPKAAKFEDALVLVSHREEEEGLLEELQKELKTQKISSIAYKMALVAAGKADAMITFHPKSEWDTAAGHLLCSEAGVRVMDFGGEEPSYNKKEPRINRGLVAPKELFKKLEKLVHSER